MEKNIGWKSRDTLPLINQAMNKINSLIYACNDVQEFKNVDILSWQTNKSYSLMDVEGLLLFVYTQSWSSWYKECNDSCVSNSYYCPPKDVSNEPNFVCYNQCMPDYYRQWYQVSIEEINGQKKWQRSSLLLLVWGQNCFNSFPRQLFCTRMF